MSVSVGEGVAMGQPGRRRSRRHAALNTGVVLSAMVVVVFGVIAVFGPVPPAFAHAVLERSDPLAGAALAASPGRVTLGFSESVGVEANSIRVLAASGERVDTGRVTSGASSNEVTIGIRSGLDRGTYVVSWRVTSADSHPISGAFAFGVGMAPTADALASAAMEKGSATVGAAAGVARFVGFIGVSLLVGAGFFLIVLWPAGRAGGGARGLVWAGWGASVAAAVALMLLQGLEASGLGISDIASSAPLSATLRDRFGHLLAIRLVALALAVPLLRAAFPRPGGPAGPAGPTGTTTVPPAVPPWGKIELGALGAVIVVTTAMIGHGGAGERVWLASASLAVHVTAMAVWVGGLAVLAVCFLRPLARPPRAEPGAAGASGGAAGAAAGAAGTATGAADSHTAGGGVLPAGRAAELAQVLPLWSRTAMVAVILIIATGLFQAWREVGTLPAVVGTDYGRLLLLKTSIVVLMIGLAALARRWVIRHYRLGGSTRSWKWSNDRSGVLVHAFAGVDAPAPPAAPDRPAAPARPAAPNQPGQPIRGGEVAVLRRGVVAEAVLGVAVLAVTAVLVNTIPARTSYSPPFSDIVAAGPLTVDVQVEPTNRGVQAIHVYAYGPAGGVQPLQEARAQLSLPDAGVGPFEVPLVVAGPGHATAEGVQVPLPGVWQLRLTLRVSEFDQYVTTVFYEVH